MAFEAEVFPLFLAGILIVSALELLFGMTALRGRKRGQKLLVGHTVSMLLAFFFPMSMLLINRGVEMSIPSITNSAAVGLFGILWAVSVSFLVALIGELIK